MSADVVVCGSLHMDIVVMAPDRPRRGETLAGSSWRRVPGGKGRNQAVEAAAAGAPTAFIGMVGADEFGTALLADLGQSHVDVAHVGISTASGSGMSVAIVDDGGDYGAVIVSGANLDLHPPHIEAAAELIGQSRWLVLQNEVPDAANIAAARLARRGGAKTMLNAAPARPLAAGLLGLVDILVVNALEAEALDAGAVASLDEAQRAAEHLLPLAETVIVTAGGAGVALASRSGYREGIAAHRVEIVSTHGAGDCFVGTLAAELAQGIELGAAAHDANHRAARHVSSMKS